VKRGDLDGCSFIYSTDEKENVAYTKTEDEEGNERLVRHVVKIDNIYDFTLTWRPAYKQTECSARERELLEGMSPVKDIKEKKDDTVSYREEVKALHKVADSAFDF
jgi:phage head maturation protease